MSSLTSEVEADSRRQPPVRIPLCDVDLLPGIPEGVAGDCPRDCPGVWLRVWAVGMLPGVWFREGVVGR